MKTWLSALTAIGFTSVLVGAAFADPPPQHHHGDGGGSQSSGGGSHSGGSGGGSSSGGGSHSGGGGSSSGSGGGSHGSSGSGGSSSGGGGSWSGSSGGSHGSSGSGGYSGGGSHSGSGGSYGGSTHGGGSYGGGSHSGTTGSANESGGNRGGSYGSGSHSGSGGSWGGSGGGTRSGGSGSYGGGSHSGSGGSWGGSGDGTRSGGSSSWGGSSGSHSAGSSWSGQNHHGGSSYGTNNNLNGRDGFRSGGNWVQPGRGSIGNQVWRSDRLHIRDNWRSGYWGYNRGWRDDSFFFGFYCFDPFGSRCVVSPWYCYPNLPGYLAYDRVLYFGCEPIIFVGDVYNWRPVYDEGYRSDRYQDVDYAVSDIVTLFQHSDTSALNRLAPRRGNVNIFVDGQYSYSVSPNDFRDMMIDNAENTHTVDFAIERVWRNRDGARVLARHEFEDPRGGTCTVWQTYVLEYERGELVVKEFGTSERRPN